MANPERLAKLKKGVRSWNSWREANFRIDSDLSGARLGESDLEEANLEMANLSGTYVGGA
jgi:uncharacterized protein YjbI with pentapeptide repeats